MHIEAMMHTAREPKISQDMIGHDYTLSCHIVFASTFYPFFKNSYGPGTGGIDLELTSTNHSRAY